MIQDRMTHVVRSTSSVGSSLLSYYEGWGLLISDSLSFGSMRRGQQNPAAEAGGTFCVYVDLDDTTGAYKTIRRWRIRHVARLERRLASSCGTVVGDCRGRPRICLSARLPQRKDRVPRLCCCR